MPAPTIPIGLATKLGVLFGAASACAALITAILQGNHTPETIAALLTAAAPIYAVIKGRMDQATAHAANSLPPMATLTSSSGKGVTITGGWVPGSGVPGKEVAIPGDNGDDGDDQLPAELEQHPVTEDPPDDEVDLPHGTVTP